MLGEATRLAVELVRTGEVETFAEAARRTGASRAAVAEACGRRDIESKAAIHRRESSRKRYRAVALVRKGLTREEAARELGVSHDLVNNACCRAGLSGGKGRRPKFDRAALRAVWHLVLRRELAVKDLAGRWGVTVQAIRQAAKALGLPATGPKYGPW